MSKRDAVSSKWKIPLFSGTDTAKRANLQYDPNDLIGTLPGPAPWQLPGLILWWDAGSRGTLHGGALISQVDDRSGNGADGTQPDPAKRPTLLTTTLAPQALNFEG